MARTMNYIGELYSIPSGETRELTFDLEYLDDIISGIVFFNSVLSLTNSLGYKEYVEDLVGTLKEHVGRFLEVLAVEGTYVPGLASYLATKIGKRLWELDISDSALAEFLNLLVGYRVALAKGSLGSEDSEELLELTCSYLHIPSCGELRRILQPLTPSLAFQVALTGLAISVGGIGV